MFGGLFTICLFADSGGDSGVIVVVVVVVVVVGRGTAYLTTIDVVNGDVLFMCWSVAPVGLLLEAFDGQLIGIHEGLNDLSDMIFLKRYL